MQKVMATFRAAPGVSISSMASAAQREADAIVALYRQGVVQEAYYGDAVSAGGDGVIAVVVLEAASAREAQRIVDGFPLVRAGMVTPTLVPLNAYEPFGERLRRAGLPTPDWWPQ